MRQNCKLGWASNTLASPRLWWACCFWDLSSFGVAMDEFRQTQFWHSKSMFLKNSDMSSKKPVLLEVYICDFYFGRMRASWRLSRAKVPHGNVVQLTLAVMCELGSTDYVLPCMSVILGFCFMHLKALFGRKFTPKKKKNFIW